MVAVPVCGLSLILTTVLSANLNSGLFSAEVIKSSVRMSSTLRISPLASCIRDPLAKLPGTVLLFNGFFGDRGGDITFDSRFDRLPPTSLVDGFCKSNGADNASSGLVSILCFKEPSFPDGTLKVCDGDGGGSEFCCT